MAVALLVPQGVAETSLGPDMEAWPAPWVLQQADGLPATGDPASLIHGRPGLMSHNPE